MGSVQRGEASNMLRIPLAPFELVAAAGSAIFAAVLLAQAWRALRPLRAPEARR
jgi:hypothetical protein